MMSKEEMREGFEAWHCEQYKTHGMTGAPTRDFHGGVYAEKYGPKKQQALWECWQETGGDVAKVEALKDEIERVELGKKAVVFLMLGDIFHGVDGPEVDDWDIQYDHKVCNALAQMNPGAQIPLFTRSDAGEVDRLNTVIEQQKNLIASLRAELTESYSITDDTLRAQLDEAHSLFADVLSIDVPRTAQSLERMRSILSAIAEPGDPACCTPTAEEKALLENGDYTPEELWGASKPSCPKCHKAEQVVWIGMEDLPEYAVGARYRIILDDVRQECTELEKEDGKRWFRGDDSGTFPIDEIQAWLPIAEPANKEGAQ